MSFRLIAFENCLLLGQIQVHSAKCLEGRRFWVSLGEVALRSCSLLRWFQLYSALTAQEQEGFFFFTEYRSPVSFGQVQSAVWFWGRYCFTLHWTLRGKKNVLSSQNTGFKYHLLKFAFGSCSLLRQIYLYSETGNRNKEGFFFTEQTHWKSFGEIRIWLSCFWK